jgi:hypothetical protein
MAIILTSVFGGVPDPYEEDGPITDIGRQFDAVNEATPFLDIVNIDLTPADPLNPPYTAITNIGIGVTIQGLVVNVNEITENNETNLNITYEAPQPSVLVLGDLQIETNIFNSNTQGNVEVFGTIDNAFIDKFFEYEFLNSDINVRVSGLNNVPDNGVNLYLYKPSFMRHNTILFYLNVEYDFFVTENFVIQKRLLNDWEISRIALINKLQTIGV